MTTYLYHKRHIVTGLNYFGKTTKDPYKYRGSGIHWLRHLRKHGNQIETLQVWAFDNIDDCKNFAIAFSQKFNIVKSNQWANLVIENGIDGQSPGFKNIKLSEYNRQHNKDRKNKPGYTPNRLGKKDSAETIAKKRQAHLGKKFGPIPEERKQKISLACKGPRPHTSGKNNSMYGYQWSDAQKALLKAKRKGKVWWNNGKVCTMSVMQPGDDYIRGRLPKR